MEDDEDLDEGIDEEERESRREAREALNSAALSRVMNASKRKDGKQTLDDAILGGWKIIGESGDLTGYAGCIHVETVLKNPKKYSGKIKLYDSYIAVYRGGRRVVMHKVKYSGGFRRSDDDIFAKIVEKLA